MILKGYFCWFFLKGNGAISSKNTLEVASKRSGCKECNTVGKETQKKPHKRLFCRKENYCLEADTSNSSLK